MNRRRRQLASTTHPPICDPVVDASCRRSKRPQLKRAHASSTFRQQASRADVRPRRNRPEDIIQRAVFEHLRVRCAPGVFAFHPPNGGWRSRIEAAILKGLGVRAGVPDVIAVKDGRTYALEIKSPGGRLTAAQNAAHAALRAAGATVLTSYSLDDAISMLEEWGLLRGRAQ